MNDLLGRAYKFEQEVFPSQLSLYNKLARHGQKPKALMISCSDSRIVPEQIMQAEPGELFVCRNAGNIVPPYSQANGGVSSTVEFAVAGLGVRDIIVCGHSDCGAMKCLFDQVDLARMPNVAAWLRHAHSAQQVVNDCYPHLEGAEQVRAVALENIVSQIAHLRTHPSVAAGIALGEISLHGWFVDIHAGTILGLDGSTGRFTPLREERFLPIAVPRGPRMAADFFRLEAAE